MKNIHRAPALLLALLCLLSLLAPAALAAGEAGTVSLRTAEDLETLARNCSLDTWSQGKTVVLEQDIDLTGRAFTPIPTFGGTFLGQGHTISGVSLTGSGSTQGFFRYLQPGALVQDLNVAGALAPSGQRNTLGGLAGYLVTGWLWRILPDRDRIDEKSYEKGERVTFPRRCFALLVDMLFVSLLYGLLSIFRLPFAFPAAYLLYFGLFQWACGGKSLGKRLTKFCVVNRDGSRVLLWRNLLRYALLELFCYAFWGVAWVFRQLPLDSSLVGVFLVAVWLFAGLCALLLEAAVNRSAGAQRDYLYGRLSGTRLKSTVQEKAAASK